MDLSFLPNQNTDEDHKKFRAVTKVTRSYSLNEFFNMVESKHHGHSDDYMDEAERHEYLNYRFNGKED